jgi:hypothetical protein
LPRHFAGSPVFSAYAALQETKEKNMASSEPAARGAVLSLANERAARRLGWTPESPVTWREFLEQYPYGAREIANTGRSALGTAA